MGRAWRRTSSSFSRWRSSLLRGWRLLLLHAGPQLPTATPTIFAPGVISGPAWDMAPAFTPDGRTVYFTRASPSVSTILVSHLERGGWSRPAIAPFSGEWNVTWNPPCRRTENSSSWCRTGQPSAAASSWMDSSMAACGRDREETSGASTGRATPGGLPSACPTSSTGAARSLRPAWCGTGASISWWRAVTRGRSASTGHNSKMAHTCHPSRSPGATAPRPDVDPAVAPDESYAVFGSAARRRREWISFSSAAAMEPGDSRSIWENRRQQPRSDAEARLSPDGQTLYFASDRVVPAHFPRTPAQAREDLARIDSWDNGNYNIWQVSLVPWLKGGMRQVGWRKAAASPGAGTEERREAVSTMSDSTLRRATLPNGLAVAYQVKAELRQFYDDIFVRRIYLRGGLHAAVPGRRLRRRREHRHVHPLRRADLSRLTRLRLRARPAALRGSRGERGHRGMHGDPLPLWARSARGDPPPCVLSAQLGPLLFLSRPGGGSSGCCAR